MLHSNIVCDPLDIEYQDVEYQYPLFKASFVDASMQPATDSYVRRNGRPHKVWIPDVYKDALRLADIFYNIVLVVTGGVLVEW